MAKIKTNLEHLIELRDTSQRKVLSLEAEISLIDRSLILMQPNSEKQQAREAIRDAAKREKEGHGKMVEKLDEMIAQEEKKLKSK